MIAMIFPPFHILRLFRLALTHTLFPHNRPQSSNHQRPRKAMGGPNTPTPHHFLLLTADVDGPLCGHDAPPRRFARQNRAPTVQPPLRTRVYARAEKRRPRRSPARTRRSRSRSRGHARGRGAHRPRRTIVFLNTRRQRGEASEAQAQKGEATASVIRRSRGYRCRSSIVYYYFFRRDAPRRDRHIACCAIAE